MIEFIKSLFRCYGDVNGTKFYTKKGFDAYLNHLIDVNSANRDTIVFPPGIEYANIKSIMDSFNCIILNCDFNLLKGWIVRYHHASSDRKLVIDFITNKVNMVSKPKYKPIILKLTTYGKNGRSWYKDVAKG